MIFLRQQLFQFMQHPVIGIPVKQLTQGCWREHPFTGNILQQPAEHGRERPAGMVPVDIAHHHVLRKHQALQRRNTLFCNGKPLALRVGHKRLNQPININTPVRNITVVRVTHEVVHLVRVERAADELAEARFAHNQFNNRFGRYLPLIMQNFSNRRNSGMLLIDKVLAKLFMMREDRLVAELGNLLLNDVGMGKVANIVQKRSRKQHPAVVVIKPELLILKALG